MSNNQISRFQYIELSSDNNDMNSIFNYLDSHETARKLYTFGTLFLGSVLIGTIISMISSL